MRGQAVLCCPDINQNPLQDKFEAIISDFMENRIGQMDHFLDNKLSDHLRDNLLSLLSEKQFKVAGIGSKSKFQANHKMRSDLIYWLKEKEADIHEKRFFKLIDGFIEYLNRTCFTSITGYEFHYAYYDKGTSYKRHLDQFKDNSDRAFSMIMYLNENWLEADGGQLRVFQPESEQTISPINGRCVFFKSSELEHEVLLSHKPRMSITGWLKTN